MRLASRPWLYCPYCYEQIQEHQIEFRCTGQLSRSGKRCDRTVDEQLRDRMHFSASLPPAFAADGRRNAAQCPHCGAETTVRICPVCHSRLPVHFGKVPSRLIVPVGAKGGFVVRRMPAERDAQAAEVIACSRPAVVFPLALAIWASDLPERSWLRSWTLVTPR